MVAGNRSDDEEAEAAPLRADGVESRCAVEAPKDPLQLRRRYSDPLIDDPHRDPILRGLFELDPDADVGRRILHRVVDQVPDRRLQLLDIAENNRARSGVILEFERVFVEMKARSCELDALACNIAEINTAAPFAPESRSRAARTQDLLNRVQQPIAVFEHDAVELFALLRIELARLQRLQIQTDGRHGSFQLVRDRIEKGILLLVPADFTYQENGVQHHSRDDQAEEDDAEDRQHAHPPVQNDPADVERDCNGNETDAEDGEEDHRSPAAPDHGKRIL